MARGLPSSEFIADVLGRSLAYDSPPVMVEKYAMRTQHHCAGGCVVGGPLVGGAGSSQVVQHIGGKLQHQLQVTHVASLARVTDC